MYSGMSNISDPHMKGVGILLSKNIRAALLEWNPITERIITARVETKFRKMSIVQCYAPTEDAEPTEKEVFYSLLDRTLTATHRSDIVSMMGDFNVKGGCANEDIEYIKGRYGLPQRNENGELLIEICGRHG
jgi:exonuclease III